MFNNVEREAIRRGWITYAQVCDEVIRQFLADSAEVGMYDEEILRGAMQVWVGADAPSSPVTVAKMEELYQLLMNPREEVGQRIMDQLEQEAWFAGCETDDEMINRVFAVARESARRNKDAP